MTSKTYWLSAIFMPDTKEVVGIPTYTAKMVGIFLNFSLYLLQLFRKLTTENKILPAKYVSKIYHKLFHRTNSKNT